MLLVSLLIRLAAPIATPGRPPLDPCLPHTLSPAGLAAFVEVLSEPLYILAATRLLFGLRVGVETAAQGAKGVLTLALVRRPGYPPALAFSWAQLAYAAVTLVGYATYFLPQLLTAWRGQRQQQPRPVANVAGSTAKGQAAAAQAADRSSGGDGEILRLAGTFTLQVRLLGAGCWPTAWLGRAAWASMLLLQCCCGAAWHPVCLAASLVATPTPVPPPPPTPHTPAPLALAHRRPLRSWCLRKAARWQWQRSRAPATRACMGWWRGWAPSSSERSSSPLRRPPSSPSAKSRVRCRWWGPLVGGFCSLFQPFGEAAFLASSKEQGALLAGGGRG